MRVVAEDVVRQVDRMEAERLLTGVAVRERGKVEGRREDKGNRENVEGWQDMLERDMSGMERCK